MLQIDQFVNFYFVICKLDLDVISHVQSLSFDFLEPALAGE